MLFCAKLNLLMTTLGVSNNRLARALSVDASLVSRWRTGTRTPGKNSAHIQTIAGYFSGQAKLAYQKAALFEIMGMDPQRYDHDPCSLAELLFKWLIGEAPPNVRIVGKFIGNLEMLRQQKAVPPVENSHPDSEAQWPKGMPLRTEVFFGIKGKQDGVIRFLSAVAAQTKPCTLLLYSDENIAWFSEDREFLAGFVRLLTHVISLGHKIKMVHNVSRDMAEMFAAIDFWVPLYLSGAVEPYYCPRYREHYFRRTMFIAPQVAALTSATLAGNEGKSANYYCEDPGYVNTLTDEFNNFLAICRPLMHIFTGSNPAGLDDVLAQFAQEPGHCLVLSNSLSAVTMPARLLEGILDRHGVNAEEKQKMLSLGRAYEQSFRAGLANHRYTEIVSLPAPEDILSGQVQVDPLLLFGGVALNYSPHEYRRHAEHIIDLLNSHKNYSFLISRRQGSLGNIQVMAKEDVGVIVIKPDTPPAVFFFDQPNMTNAFYCYLEDMINRIPHKDKDRQEVAATLAAMALLRQMA